MRNAEPYDSSQARFSDFSREEILKMHDQLQGTATTLAAEKDNELLDIACNSKGYRNRIAGAWAIGMKYGKHSQTDKMDVDLLLNLITDEHELVVYAARESCKHIALIRFGKDVDFGPQMNSSHEERGSSRELWESFLSKKEKDLQQYNAKKAAEEANKNANKQFEKTGNNLAAPRLINGKTVKEILGVE